MTELLYCDALSLGAKSIWEWRIPDHVHVNGFYGFSQCLEIQWMKPCRAELWKLEAAIKTTRIELEAAG